MNETKALAANLCEIKTDDETMTIEGYGAVFGNVDSYGDVIAPGAFAKTLNDHLTGGSMPKMLLQHDAFNSLPIGKWTEMREDANGLYVKGRLIDTSAGRDAYTALKEGVVDGLSIGFRPIEFTRRAKPEEPKRTLKMVDLLEVSVVTFPANGKARVMNVKSADAIMTVRDLEEALEERGYSKSEARSIVSRFESKSELEERVRDENVLKAAQALIKTLRAA